MSTSSSSFLSGEDAEAWLKFYLLASISILIDAKRLTHNCMLSSAIAQVEIRPSKAVGQVAAFTMSSAMMRSLSSIDVFLSLIP